MIFIAKNVIYVHLFWLVHQEELSLNFGSSCMHHFFDEIKFLESLKGQTILHVFIKNK